MDAIARLNARLSERYAVEREIGAGGMATVYLARDLKHNRKVALKVLRAELGAVLGPERFLSEIQVTANLQHPHLLPLFDSGEVDGLLFYVMPYVEGESLRDRLDRERQLPVDEVVRLVSAVASALDYAHRHNVIHRDLKPENILLHDGQPVVADFGIALAVSNAGGARVTQTGLSLGTPQYMSPEQATGDRVLDSRTDIYSLGAVAYEMLVGDPPHLGSTAQAIIAKVLTERPPSIRSSRPSVPEHVEAAVAHALEKLPADRWATASEFANVLTGKSAWTGSSPFAGTVTAQSVARRRVARMAPWIVAAAGVAWAMQLQFGGGPAGSGESPVTRAFVTLPESTQLGVTRPLTISSDGRTIAFVAGKITASRRLYVRPSDALESRPITEPLLGLASPTFSPDGSEIAFLATDSIMRVRVGGGAVTVVARLRVPLGTTLSWGADNMLLAGTGREILRIPAAGGVMDTLIDRGADSETLQIGRPMLLPDRRKVLFSAAIRGRGGARLEARILDLQTREVRTIVDGGWTAVFVPPDLLVYVGEGNALMAQSFDARRGTVTGPAVPVIQSLVEGAIAANGTAVFAGAQSVDVHLSSITDRGAPVVLPIPASDIRSVRFSPDGRRLVHGRQVGDGRVFVTDLALGTNVSILPEGWAGFDPFWSPDGESVTFHSMRGRATAGFDGFAQNADGSGTPRQLFRDSLAVAPQAWLPDGRLLSRASTGRPGAVGADLVVHTMQGDSAAGPAVPWLRADWDERSATASPDGRWIAFVSGETGRDEITVRPYPDPSAGKWQVSENGAVDPVWSRDGNTLYYWEGPSLRAARLRTRPSFSVLSRETVLTGVNYYRSCCFPNYDVSADGRRIILAQRMSGERASGFVLVVNWVAEVRAKVAAARRP